MIETERLLVFPLAFRDLEEVRQLHNHPETIKWLSDSHLVEAKDQQSWFEKLQKSHASRRYVIRAKVDSKLIGVFRSDRLDLENKSVEIGLDIDFHNRRLGFGREIYNSFIPYFFYELNLNRLSLITLETNHAAISLYESLGFVKEGLLRQAIWRDLAYVNAIQYGLLREEYNH